MPFAALAALIYVFVGGTSILLLNKVPGEAIRNANALSLLQGKSVWLLLALSAFLIFILLTNQATPGPKAGAGSTRAAPPPPTGGEQAGTSLRLAEARYRALVEQVPAAVYTERFDQHGVQTYVSPQIKQLTGYTPSEWLAEPGLWQSRILPEDRETAVREDERTNRTLEPYRCEYRLVRRDGSLIWVRDQAVLVRDDDGAPLYWQGILVDITGQKRVNEAVVQSEERFSKAFRSSPMPTCLTTWEEGSLIDANPAFWTLTEYAPGELSGRPLVQSHGGIEKHREFLRQLEQRKSLKGLQEKLITKSGRVLDVSVSHEIIRLNDRECILSMFQDVTEQKRAQEGLLRKDAILGSIAFAANEFLKSPRWAANIQPILDRLGSAAEASRVYITRVAPDEHDRFVATRMFESCAPGASPQIENPLQKSFEMAGNGWERWAFLLQRGETIHGIVRGFPSAEQAELIREEIRSIICVPITVSGQWWGYIALDDCLSERVWTENEIEALQAAASILSAAIQRELDGEAAEKQLQELIMLQAVALACSTASDIGGLIQSVTGIIRNTLRPDHCTVELGDEMRRFLLPHPSYRGDASEELNRQNGMIAGIGWRVASSGKAVRIGDVRTISDIVEVSPGIRSALCVPILSDGEVVGVINIESGQMNAFGEDDERLINTIAGSVATAMQKIRLFEAEARRARQAEALREATTALTT
ncbi:MAG: PAS domain S-box protein, partial [Bacteroidota bacterium]